MSSIRYDVCYLIFVVETNNKALTDDKYIKKFLQTHYNEYYSILIKPSFIYMDGCTNYNSDETMSTINSELNNIYDYKNAYVKIIYCFDRDRINKDKIKIGEYITFCLEHKFEFVLFSKEIEDCFKPKWVKNKVETAKRYYSSSVSKSSLPIEIFEHSIDECQIKHGISNLNLVLNPIISKIK